VKNSWGKNHSYGDEGYFYSSGSILEGFQNYVHGYKVDKKKLYVTSVQCFTSLTRKELKGVGQIYGSE
jgi:C1A family cysteine protease